MIKKNELENVSEIKTISYDIDGTITQWTSVPAFLETVLKEFDLPYCEEVMKEFFRVISYNEAEITTTGEVDSDKYGSLLGHYITILRENHISGVLFKDQMFRYEPHFTKMNRDVKDTLEELSYEYQQVAYSNWYLKQVLKKLEMHEISDYFERLYTFETNYIKLSGVGFHRMMLELGRSPNEMIHVGDSSSDIDVARSRKIQGVLVDYHENKQDLYDHATAVITEFKDMKTLLKK